jgi:TolA-binding protein
MIIRWLTFCLLLLLPGAGMNAATQAETRAFNAAKEIFSDKLYSIAEVSFASFVTQHPSSDLRAEAVLFQAKSRLYQTNHAGAAKLLEEQLPQAGRLADQYHFWIAESFSLRGEFQAAADKFGELVTKYPDSSLFLEACCNQARTLAKLNQWDQVVTLLGAPESAFNKAVKARSADRFAAEGLSLLGEAYFAKRQFANTEKVLASLNASALSSDYKWKQQHLITRSQMALGKLEAALSTSSNLVQAATLTSQAATLAESIDLQARIFELLNRLPEAVATHERNLVDNAPAQISRHALLKIIELTLAQNKTAEVIKRLETVIEQKTNTVAMDLAFFTLGELQLKAYFHGVNTQSQTIPLTNGTATSLLDSALTNFNLVITNFPQSDCIGKAFLRRGWCYWVAEKYDFAKTNFSEAIARLPVSEEQAVARCKLADAQFKLGEFAGAISNYHTLIAEFGNMPAVREGLFDSILYQMVRAGIQSGDHETARTAMTRLLEWYPNTGYAERVRLLVGQYLIREGNPAEARSLFSDFLKKFPTSPLVPQVELAMAQSFMQEGQWQHAIDTFGDWIKTFSNHTLLPHAEFSLALATYRSGQETNALSLFTNFVARFPSNSLAPMSQNWIGDFYFNREEFVLAEENYQLVSKLNPTLEVACQSRISAGRAAFERQGFKEAKDYFLSVINDTNTPASFAAEAYFALGDTIYTQFLADTNRPPDDFREAVSAFTRVTKDFSTNPLAPLAWGKLGECYFQWALLTKDSANYDLATSAFGKVIESSDAPTAARDQATIRVGNIFESKGDIDQAMQQYTKVLYVQDGVEFDPRSVKEAGLAAARLCESRQEWEQAINIYRRILSLLPSLKGSLEKKISLAQVNLFNNAPARN